MLRAYPNPVSRIRRALALDDRAAGALLLEGLLHPGFDPALGAQSNRKYVSSKARIAVLKERKIDHVGLHTWEQLGITERHYYKLMPRFSRRVGRRWQVDDDVLKEMRSFLRDRHRRHDLHELAMSLLQERGFSFAGARKWLQRHPISRAVHARPRAHRRSSGDPARAT